MSMDTIVQEFEFEVVVRLGKKSRDPDHLSLLETREDLTGINMKYLMQIYFWSKLPPRNLKK